MVLVSTGFSEDCLSLVYIFYRASSSPSSPVSTQTNKPKSDFSRSYSPRISLPQSVSEITHSETDNGSYGVVSSVSSYTISESSTTNGSSISSTSTVSSILVYHHFLVNVQILSILTFPSWFVITDAQESPLAGNFVEQQVNFSRFNPAYGECQHDIDTVCVLCEVSCQNQNLEAEVRRLRLELKQFKKDKDTTNQKENVRYCYLHVDVTIFCFL